MGRKGKLNRKGPQREWSRGYSSKALEQAGVHPIQLLLNLDLARRSPWHRRRYQLRGFPELTTETAREIMDQARAIGRLQPGYDIIDGWKKEVRNWDVSASANLARKPGTPSQGVITLEVTDPLTGVRSSRMMPALLDAQGRVVKLL